MGLLGKLLSAGYYNTYNRFVAKEIGLESAILLGALFDLVDGFGNGFFCQQDRLMEKTCLSKYSIGAATKNLVDRGFVKTELRGVPAQLFYTVDEAAVFQFLENAQQVSGSSPSFSKSSNITIPNIESISNSTSLRTKSDTPKPIKHKYGSFKNVLLTDDEVAKLRDKFPDWQQRVESASLYLEAKGDKYKSHYAMLLKWAVMDEERKKAERPKEKHYDNDFGY